MLLKLLSILFLLISPVYADTTVDGYSVDQVQTLDVVGDCPLDISSIGNARICFDETLGKLQCSENGGAYADCVGGGGAGTPGGSTTQVQYNNAGAFGGSTNFTFDGTNVDTNGTMTANKFILDGFGTAPQIYPSVDTNSGLFFSGPDVLEIHTGGLNGLAINSAQNVGVATHSPTSKLHVYNTSAGNSFEVDDQASDTTPFIIDATGNVGIGALGTLANKLQISDSGDSTMLAQGGSATLRVANNGSGAIYALAEFESSVGQFILTNAGNMGVGTFSPQAKVEVSQLNAEHAFRVNDQASDTTPFIIDATGNVGIGTSVLSAAMTIQSGGTSLPVIVFQNSSSSLTSTGIGRATNFLNGDLVSIGDMALFANANDVWMGTGSSTTRLGISGGNVGIGTVDTNPVAMLDISSTAAQDLFRVNDNGSGDTTPFLINSVGNVGIGTIAPVAELEVTQTAALDAFRVNDQATDTTPFIIDSVGNVGIGTSSPSRPLSVYVSTPVVQITNPTAGGTANDGLLLTQSALDSIIENSEAGSLYLRTTATNRVRIDAGGNVGIGSLTPAAALDVTGKIRASTGTAGQAVCWKADKTLGQCTTVVGVTGDCTCS